jgi:hypothetical protein
MGSVRVNIFDTLHYRVYSSMPNCISIEADESNPNNFKIDQKVHLNITPPASKTFT